MLPEDARIISVDDHVIEHPRVWLDRPPSKYEDVAPRIVKLPDGNDTWLYEGRQSGNFALNAVAGKHPRDFGMDPTSYDDMLPGCYDIADRIKDMDIEGIWAAALLPAPSAASPAARSYAPRTRTSPSCASQRCTTTSSSTSGAPTPPIARSRW